MSVKSSGQRTRQRRLGLIAAGVVVAGLLAGVPAATAAGSAPGKAASPMTTYTSGRYIVLLREPAAATYDGGNRHFAATRSTTGRFDARSARVQSYRAHLTSTHQRIADEFGTKTVADLTVATNGFVADLTKQQAFDLATDRRVLLVEKSTNMKVDTWHTPTFLGLTGKNGAWAKHGGENHAGDGVVIADLDTGIWPESKSFEGAPLTSTPKTKWDISRTGTATRMEKADGMVFHGECVIADTWDAGDCNTKIISARYYGDSFLSGIPEDELSEFEQVSPRDGAGHGTHTASTAAGERVEHVTTEGRKFGTVTGMAPAARLAVYKVCWEAANPDDSGCNNADIVEAIDQAVVDGADVLNFSIGGGASPELDSTELAFEGAAEAGIFVAASAGNSGPGASTLDHPSPWLTTVAASTSYNYENTIVLGNGKKKIVGASVAEKPVPSTKVVTAEDSVVTGGDADDAALCGPDTLDPALVTGKIVVCMRGVYDRVAKSAEVKRAGGKAMILVNPSPNSLDADFHSVPTIHISDTAAPRLFNYLDSAGDKATASFAVGNITKNKTPLPQVGGFSSRGPILAAGGDLLKPDISAPGVSVLAAVAPPANSGRDYDLYSGTSMAAPHITGLAAFMQSVHPNWTPMEIKSAMMTTATPTKAADGKASKDAFAQGSGQVTPKKFFDPGLFITATPVQWRGFLADLGYNTGVPAVDPKDVNVASMADASVTGETVFHRSFRASRKGTWKITSQVPGFTMKVNHARVKSKRVDDIVDVTFTFTRTTAPLGSYTQGSVTLDGPTSVRIPVALQPLSVDAPTSVSGTGTDGSVDVPLTAGFTGDLDVTAHGLAESDTVEDSVDVGDFKLECVTVTPDTSLARFAVDSIDDTADLDLFVYASDSCDINDAFAVAGQSATASGDESVTLRNPDAGAYIVEIDGFSAGTDGAPMDFAFDFWDIDPAATAGDLTVTPDPVPVVQNQETSVTVGWTGLDASSHYLGYLEYADSDQITLVDVKTGS
ncbi:MULTISPECIES: S8 family serine peptidase [unclassified Nocardioides]|uniref:S8 family serine peptidase n=1 Tax=unclassified Nocardioides TaxID=2615069 RepID=UPI0009EFA7DA|nr:MULTISPECIES: S8 family serine peptidase [unclassified Nocardioides]GAW50198.1 Peptidase S8 and S53, subtilisin, kexin, sedolisin (Precursor) [Nocardioides sp. PD653-B2]GAW53153.1 Peptidase S8 and S53, subtilisin, kexin, sedolis in (Precursor) [Nocardioides sp. PD653]